MSRPQIVDVASGSPAARAGASVGDEIVMINGVMPRDVIEWQMLTDDADPVLTLGRGGLEIELEVSKAAGEPLGIDVSSALFDRVRTCDNHCEFCFIYQLPPGMRRSLYLKDDDYRLSFLYGNFTTLTRFTELDLERVVTERLSPLHVSIHATDPALRSRMLRNNRGATSLRWLRQLLDHQIDVHGQIVVCPGLNDADALDDTLCGVLDEYPELVSVAVVPLGISQFNKEAAMRAHTQAEARAVVDIVDRWQETFLRCLGRRLVFAADEYYLLADRSFPEAETYGDFPMHEDGIGMARAFERELSGAAASPIGPQAGFFAAVDGAPAEGYRAVRNPAGDTGLRPANGPSTSVVLRPSRNAPTAVVTSTYGAAVLRPLFDQLNVGARLVEVPNEFFGGNTAVTGLMVGADIDRVLADQPHGHRYLVPDVCVSEGRFLDGVRPEALCRPVEIVPTNGIALRQALGLERALEAV